jgi:two-component sensor histidine kinase
MITMDGEKVLAADILASRPSRVADYVRESSSLDELISRINDAPGTALRSLVETVVDLTGAGSAGVSILVEDRFIWPAIAGQWARYAGGGMPLDASPCGVVIEKNTALLFDEPHRLYPVALAEPMIKELLLVPLHSEREPIGTIWALSHDNYKFDHEDARLLDRLGLFASAVEEGRRSNRQQKAGLEDGERVGETLAMIRSIVRQAQLRADDTPADDVIAELGSRINAYAGPVLGQQGPVVDLWLLIADVLSSIGEREGRRVTLQGPAIMMKRPDAAVFSLAVHELLDNAVRFGALRYPGGSIEVRWDQAECDGAPWLSFSWIEVMPQPLPAIEGQAGFGLCLLRDELPRLLGGHSSVEFGSTGLRLTLEAPIVAA